jgi:hypothetical protein
VPCFRLGCWGTDDPGVPGVPGTSDTFNSGINPRTRKWWGCLADPAIQTPGGQGPREKTFLQQRHFIIAAKTFYYCSKDILLLQQRHFIIAAKTLGLAVDSIKTKEQQCDVDRFCSFESQVFELEKLRSSSSSVGIEMRKTSSRHDDELRSPAIDESRTRRSRDIDESRTRRSRDIDESKSRPIDAFDELSLCNCASKSDNRLL